ncbi:hypothetical protein M434DRAFT_36796 [Hypoxylon sp. CO27-5]|nr:hypothetical protein M434DRAFT_36796 [Hypoxylon sp. CO27-5]
MSLDISQTCPVCHISRNGWCFPDLVTHIFEPDSPIKGPEDAANAICVFCLGAETGLIGTITSIERAKAEVIHGLKLSHHDVLRDLLRHVRLTCSTEWGSVPILIRGFLVKLIYRWRNDVLLSEILEFMPGQMDYMSKSWKIGFLQRIAELALSTYVENTLKVVYNSDKLERHQVEVAQFAKRIGELYEPSPAEIISILNELDDKLKRA